MTSEFCFIFGRGLTSFRENNLPSISQVIKHFFHIKLKENCINKSAKIVAQNLKIHWRLFDPEIPTITHSSIYNRVKSIWSKRQLLVRNKPKAKIQIFRKYCETNLFDICTCKCKTNVNDIHNIPDNSRQRLNIARNVTLHFSNVVVEPSQLNEINEIDDMESEASDESFESTECYDECDEDNKIDECDEGNEIDECDEDNEIDEYNQIDENDKDYEADTVSTRNNIKLVNTSLTADRYGISDRAVGALSSSLLADLGIITPDNKTMIIDKSKARRARIFQRKALESDTRFDGIGLFFDGRKDITLKTIEINGKLLT